MRTMNFDNRAHKMDYKSWHKCARCNTFTLFNSKPEKTLGACPDCWKLWKDLPQYRVVKHNPEALKKMRGIRIRKAPAKNKVVKNEWPIEYMLIYLCCCSLCLLVITYYLWIK